MKYCSSIGFKAPFHNISPFDIVLINLIGSFLIGVSASLLDEIENVTLSNDLK